MTALDKELDPTSYLHRVGDDPAKDTPVFGRKITPGHGDGADRLAVHCSHARLALCGRRDCSWREERSNAGHLTGRSAREGRAGLDENCRRRR